MKKILYVLSVIVFINSAQAQDPMRDKSIAKMEEALQGALQEQGVDGKLKIEINGYDNGVRLKSDADNYQVYVNGLNFNAKTKIFKADIVFISRNNKSENFKVNGSYDKFINVPVLAHKLSRDSVIRNEDIAWVEVPEKQISYDTVIHAEKLVGQSLRRNLSEFSKLQERDLQKQQILSKNTVVNILFNTPSISIKTVGVTLDSGGEGDVVRVRNSSSNKIIQAVVQDESTVAVSVDSNNQPHKTAQIEEGTYVR